MWFDRLHQGSTGCIGGDSGHLVGWVYGGLGLHLGVVGDDGEGECFGDDGADGGVGEVRVCSTTLQLNEKKSLKHQSLHNNSNISTFILLFHSI